MGYKTKNLQVYAGKRRVMAEHFAIGIDYDQFHNMYDNLEVIANRKKLFQEAAQRSHLLYDRSGDQHYFMASALQKSIRGKYIYYLNSDMSIIIF